MSTIPEAPQSPDSPDSPNSPPSPASPPSPGTPIVAGDSRHNAYQVAPEKPGDEQGYDTADPHQSDEGYTAENVLRRHGEQPRWGRTEKGAEEGQQ
jgi:hypothetical protein